MARKEFKFRGKTLQELQALSVKDFAALLPTRQRRSITRGWTDAQQSFLRNFERKQNNVKTHCRDMIILPNMVGKTLKIHNGKEFVQVVIQEEMIGHFFGEFALTRKRVGHNSPGVGATRSSSNVSVR